MTYFPSWTGACPTLTPSSLLSQHLQEGDRPIVESIPLRQIVSTSAIPPLTLEKECALERALQIALAEHAEAKERFSLLDSQIDVLQRKESASTVENKGELLVEARELRSQLRSANAALTAAEEKLCQVAGQIEREYEKLKRLKLILSVTCDSPLSVSSTQNP